MQKVKVLEILFFYILQQLFELCNNMILSETVSKHGGHEREELHLLCLVIYELGLFFLPTNVFELSSHCRIPNSCS